MNHLLVTTLILIAKQESNNVWWEKVWKFGKAKKKQSLHWENFWYILVVAYLNIKLVNTYGISNSVVDIFTIFDRSDEVASKHCCTVHVKYFSELSSSKQKIRPRCKVIFFIHYLLYICFSVEWRQQIVLKPCWKGVVRLLMHFLFAYQVQWWGCQFCMCYVGAVRVTSSVVRVGNVRSGMTKCWTWEIESVFFAFILNEASLKA